MKRLTLTLGLLGLGVALMGARPGNEFQLNTQLSGQATRWTLSDGGASGVFTQNDGGSANFSGCIRIDNAKARRGSPFMLDGGPLWNDDGGQTAPIYASFSANELLFFPLVPVNVCIRPSAVSGVWDGGCNTTPTDENFGVPYAVNTAQRVVPENGATTLCATSDAGYVSLPIWALQ